jgi:hypothetical protein
VEVFPLLPFCAVGRALPTVLAFGWGCVRGFLAGCCFLLFEVLSVVASCFFWLFCVSLCCFWVGGLWVANLKSTVREIRSCSAFESLSKAWESLEIALLTVAMALVASAHSILAATEAMALLVAFVWSLRLKCAHVADYLRYEANALVTNPTVLWSSLESLGILSISYLEM